MPRVAEARHAAIGMRHSIYFGQCDWGMGSVREEEASARDMARECLPRAGTIFLP